MVFINENTRYAPKRVRPAMQPDTIVVAVAAWDAEYKEGGPCIKIHGSGNKIQSALGVLT